MKTLASLIKSEVYGPCPCCGEPAIDPVHQLASEIFALLPARALPATEAQKVYDAAIELIRGSMSVAADIAIESFIGDMDNEDRVVN